MNNHMGPTPNSVKKDLSWGKFWDDSSEAKTLYIESAIENLAR